MVALQLKKIVISPGERLRLRDISWAEFEAILAEMGDHRGSRVSYDRGVLEIVMPLPEHEVIKELLGDMVKILLEELELDCEPFGSTTFLRQDLGQGVEPDQCFYIENHQRVRGKTRLDLAVDPPPDLVIEVDLTSKTQLEIYRGLGVKEVWRYVNQKLRIDVLTDTGYVQATHSPTFAGFLDLIEIISGMVNGYPTLGRSPTLRAFRRWIQGIS